eukprot:s3268_g2.t1
MISLRLVALCALGRLDPHFFVLPRDVFVLLSAPEVISRLAVSGFHQIFGDLSELGAGLSSWAHAYDIQRLPLRSTKRGEVERNLSRKCRMLSLEVSINGASED